MAVAAHPSRWALAGVTLLLFLVWSNSFVTISFLLGGERGPAQLDWTALPVLRFCIAALLAAIYCFGLRREESLAIIRGHWRRLAAAGFFAVPSYNLCLAYGQQHGVPPPVASLETAIAPLFLMILGTLVLKETLSLRKIAGFLIAMCGLVLIASAKEIDGSVPYAGLVIITAGAPLSWSAYSIVSKPVGNKVSILLWTYLAIIAGTLPFFLTLPFAGMPAALRLDAAGWGSLLYLSILCTLFGFAAWTWLLKHMRASSIGFTIFLNPPLTTLSKAVLSAVFPAVFVFSIVLQEWIGGAVVLAGMAVALVKRPAGAS